MGHVEALHWIDSDDRAADLQLVGGEHSDDTLDHLGPIQFRAGGFIQLCDVVNLGDEGGGGDEGEDKQ